MLSRHGFRFGLEGEYLLVDRDTYRPLWHRDFTFERLNSILEAIDYLPLLDGLSLNGLELDPPHRRLMPYYVEGYGVSGETLGCWTDLLPKGIEVRTPICPTMERCVTIYARLFDRLQQELDQHGYRAISLSHHPTQWHFTAPPNHPRHDWWRWAMQAMTTYGPDLNLSLPPHRLRRFRPDRLRRRAHYYVPAMVAFTVGSPIKAGKLWNHRGSTGLSLRTYRRSLYAPIIAEHPKEQARLEFKAFDMPIDRADFLSLFFLWLWLVLDDDAPGEADEQDCIYDLAAVARSGWAAERVIERAEEMLDRASYLLSSLDFDVACLETLKWRLSNRSTPADEIIDYFAANPSVTDLLRWLDARSPAGAAKERDWEKTSRSAAGHQRVAPGIRTQICPSRTSTSNVFRSTFAGP